MKKRIYLAGPMGGLTYEEATSWRDYVAASLDNGSNGRIESYSPLRGKAVAFDAEGKLSSMDIRQTIFTTNRAVMVRDYDDCTKADLVFANFIGAKSVSIGTVMEMAFAYTLRIPIVAVMDKGNIHDNHPMLEEAFSYKVQSLDDGIEAALTHLLP